MDMTIANMDCYTRQSPKQIKKAVMNTTDALLIYASL